MLNSWAAFAVEADGKVAMAASYDCDNSVWWLGPRDRGRSLHMGAEAGAGIRIARGRIAFERRTSCTTSTVQLAVVDIRGRRIFALKPSASASPFDFDGRRLAWVASDGIHVARVR